MIAIHERKGSFSDRWIAYCKEHNIAYKIVNCNDTDIIKQLDGCDGLLWHWSHEDYRTQNYARQLTYSLELMGIRVFPSYSNCWHFDDKVGQKYLFESIKAPLVPSYVFYEKEVALNWAKSTSYPKVFKLRGGAGSYNVKLVNSFQEARPLIDKAFSKGFPLSSGFSNVNQRMWVLKRDKNMRALIHILKGFVRFFSPREGLDLLPCQKGYIYFQDFIPHNEYDDRIVVVGNRAFHLRRKVRRGDFRASGSGLLEYHKDLVPQESLRIAFTISKKIKAQSLAFDFVYDKEGNPLIVETSYAYSMGKAYDDCPGYWDSELIWHDEPVDPQRFIIEDFLASFKD